MRMLLTDEDFDALTSGKIIQKDGIQVALQDIGYLRMLEIIEPKLKDLIK